MKVKVHHLIFKQDLDLGNLAKKGPRCKMKPQRKTSVENPNNCLRRMDLYGEPISFNINGKSTYTTTCGALTTVLIILIFMFFSELKLAHIIFTYDSYLHIFVKGKRVCFE